MRNHLEEEMVPIREAFYEWYFDPFREGNLTQFAKKHGINPGTLTNWRKKPEFLEKLKNFRETYQETGNEALQNLLRFAVDENPKVAIPALKITADVMGWNAPTQVQHTADGMTLFQYLEHINKAAVAPVDQPKQLSEPVIEGVFSADPWETEEAAA